MASSSSILPRSPRGLATRLDYLVRNRLWAQIIVAMVLGIGTGLLLSPSGGAIVPANTANAIASWLALPGNLFLALIQMVVVPLVLSSIIIGIAGNSDTDFLRRAGLRIAPYFVTTTTVAVLIGASLALWIEPGHYIDMSTVAIEGDSAEAIDAEHELFSADRSFPERIIDVIPTNPTSAILHRSMFQIVILAIFLSVALTSISQARAKPIMDLVASIQEISMKVVSWAMALAPAAVFGLLAQVSVQVGLEALVGVSVYVGTVILGLLILHVVYLLIVGIVGRRSPFKFLSNIRDVQLLAFSTSSSAAVMPLSMQTAETKLHVKRSIARFIVPLGATVNMDGTALYQMVAAIFLTQLFGIELGYAELALLAVTTVGASIGSPSTPGVGIVILATIVQSLGVPAAGIALILGVDRILDMLRTAVNVTGDLAACVVLDKWLSPDND
jgi:proton glutamate symport protein